MVTSKPTMNTPILRRAQVEQQIIEAMQVLERRALAVTRITLTKPIYDLIGQPVVFEMARVTVGDSNFVMSDPEFFGYERILLDGSKRKTQEELDREWAFRVLFDWRMLLIMVGWIGLILLLTYRRG